MSSSLKKKESKPAIDRTFKGINSVLWFDSGALSPCENMAIDEVLFLRGLPILRFYDWSETAYSIGYFQSAKEFNDSFPLVRRITGGGTVKHGSDLTFSIVCDLKMFPSLDSVQQSYFWIHQGLLRALKKLKIPAEIFYEEKHRNGRFCFQAPSPGDLLLDKSKIAGGAQRRRGKILLHQGSIQISQLQAERHVLIQAILEAFAHTFKLDLKEGFDTLSMIENPIIFLKQKYSSEAWTYKF